MPRKRLIPGPGTNSDLVGGCVLHVGEGEVQRGFRSSLRGCGVRGSTHDVDLEGAAADDALPVGLIAEGQDVRDPGLGRRELLLDGTQVIQGDAGSGLRRRRCRSLPRRPASRRPSRRAPQACGPVVQRGSSAQDQAGRSSPGACGSSSKPRLLLLVVSVDVVRDAGRPRARSYGRCVGDPPGRICPLPASPKRRLSRHPAPPGPTRRRVRPRCSADPHLPCDTSMVTLKPSHTTRHQADTCRVTATRKRPPVMSSAGLAPRVCPHPLRAAPRAPRDLPWRSLAA